MPSLPQSPPKDCPRCRGFVTIERDLAGTYGSCMMCGYVQDVGAAADETSEREERMAATPGRRRYHFPRHGGSRL
jgi:hypothetical protein